MKAVLFEYLPRVTINEKGAKTVWVRCAGYEKRRVTVMLHGDSNGNRYPPFIVMKSPPSMAKVGNEHNAAKRHGFGVHVWKKVSSIQVQHGVQIHGNASAWWNYRLTLQFLRHNFGDRANKNVPILLLLDDFSGHWTKEVKEYAAEINVHLLKVPPNFTSVCQPADVAWNRPFKARLRELWTNDLASQVTAHEKDIVSFKLKVADREKLTSWIVDSWGQVSPETIQNGFSGSKIPPQQVQHIANHLMDALVDSLSVDEAVTSDRDMSDEEDSDISDQD